MSSQWFFLGTEPFLRLYRAENRGRQSNRKYILFGRLHGIRPDSWANYALPLWYIAVTLSIGKVKNSGTYLGNVECDVAFLIVVPLYPEKLDRLDGRFWGPRKLSSWPSKSLVRKHYFYGYTLKLMCRKDFAWCAYEPPSARFAES